MDSATIKKYFNLGDEVEISCPNITTTGKIVDFSDSVLVVEDMLGNPVIIAIDNVISCRKKTETILNPEAPADDVSPESDEIAKVTKEIITTLEDIYSNCAISNDTLIPTNAVVTGMSPKGVEVKTDDGEIITCVKSSFVGYSRENAAIGKRVFCSSSKDNISYASLTEMSYGEMHERFIRAINTKPKPRTPILNSVLVLLTKEFGNTVVSYKKVIKQLIKELTRLYDSETPIISTRIKLNDLSPEQKSSIYDLLVNHISELSEMQENDRTKYAESLIYEKIGIKIRRIGVKTIVEDVIKNGKLSMETDESEDSNTTVPPTINETDDTFISATCEINKYYTQHHNGLASDSKNSEIRFKDDVVVEDSLIDELKRYQWWTKASQPIPVVCVYKRTGKWQNALFISKPGTLVNLEIKLLIFWILEGRM